MDFGERHDDDPAGDVSHLAGQVEDLQAFADDLDRWLSGLADWARINAPPSDTTRHKHLVTLIQAVRDAAHDDLIKGALFVTRLWLADAERVADRAGRRAAA